MDFHERVGGVARGRRAISLSSLNKSGVVLLCAAWETYIERVLQETANRSILRSRTPHDLPKPIQRLVANHVRVGKDEGAWRSLAGRGWREVAKSVVSERTAALNTPKPGPVRELFKAVLGIDNVTDDWCWAKNDNDRVLTRLADFVSMRGSIAHGELLAYTVKKSHLRNQVDLIERIVPIVERRVVHWQKAFRETLRQI